MLGIENIKMLLFPRQKPILVFTMAKVGSLSVYFSLKKWMSKNTIFHIHSLNEEEVKKGIQLCFKNNIYPGSKSPIFLINRKVINKGKPFKIICLFRDPLERNISAFFDAFKLHTGEIPKDYKGEMNGFLALYYKKLNHMYPINWFEKQFFEATGINIYDYSFNKEKGYQIVKIESIEVLIVNSNVADSKKEDLIRDFCELKYFKLKNRNVSTSKEYADYYKEFKEKARFSKEYLNKLYGSNYAKHFFTDKHIENQKEKWKD